MDRNTLRPASPAQALRCAGFTLIELLVVLVIIGIIITFITLSVGVGGRPLDTEARRVAAVLELAAQEAVLQSRELAVFFAHDGYIFLTPGAGGWQPMEDDAVLRPRQLPPEIRLDLEIERRPPASTGEKGRNAPQVLLLSSGETTPFELTISSTAEPGSYLLKTNGNGHFTLIGRPSAGSPVVSPP